LDCYQKRKKDMIIKRERGRERVKKGTFVVVIMGAILPTTVTMTAEIEIHMCTWKA